MIVLGIETSCDETGAAVVRRSAGGCVVLSNVVASQYDLHAEYAGVVPEIASRAHVEALLPTVREALEQAGLGLGMVDAIAVGNRPGLIGSLLVGVGGAKGLAWALGKPLIGVDHVLAHLYSGVVGRRGEGERASERTSERGEGSAKVRECEGASGIFPALGLVVSGGHTSLYEVSSWTSVKRLGATIDDAMGEAFDKVATILGLPHPGGPNLDKLSRESGANDRAVDLPISRISTTSLDFSFSGLKTAVLYAVKGVPEDGKYPLKSPLTHEQKRDLAASFQRAACRAITIKIERALEQAQTRGVTYRSLLTGGGVTANSRLRGELTALGTKHGLRVLLPAMELCMDNAAMIAGLGAELVASGKVSDFDLQAVPTASH
ncbi:MAG: tRNA (adenosine(37)-N6)-threonylcarbamoyltransferase complex transferase subunit TsaD [Phycisphaerales bacterium]